MVKLSELDCEDSSQQAIFAIVEVFMDGEQATLDRGNSATGDAAKGSYTEASELDEHEGTSLLRHISSEKVDSKLSKLVVPVAMVHHRKPVSSTGPRGHSGRLIRPSSGGLDKPSKSKSSGHHESAASGPKVLEPPKMFKCLDAGAADVLPSPLSESRVSGLTLHAYRAHKEASKERAALLATKRNRKRSWVGFDDRRPYAYLREQMVSGLMTGICDPDNVPYSFDLRVSPIAALLKPFDALTLLISAIGHDVGHPGVNNAFLVALNAPLAQLYNDKSVLESFHCAAFSQILRRYWKHAFEDTTMRALMINSILATDMGLHFKYMTDLGNLQQKVHDNGGTDGWSPQILEEYRTLTCGLLIKCADISNVARPFSIAAQWADILQLEFANQGVMEKDVGIETTLFGGPPEIGNTIKLANSQNGFMNIFARPLFESVTDILPTMAFAVNEMKTNTETWKGKIEHIKLEGKREEQTDMPEAHLSPRSRTPNHLFNQEERDRSSSQPELSHPEGLPASNSPIQLTLPTSMQHLEEHVRRTSVDRTHELRETPDRSSSPFRDSRRSSLAQTSGYVGSAPEQPSFSRRSSGAFSAAQRPTYSTRRSSNTSPSQLQLGVASDARPQVSSENTQPSARGSEDTLSQPNRDPDRSSVGSGGGGDITHRGNKNGENYRSARLSNHNASCARFSTHSNHQRDSSGAHTSMSQSTPYSPTGTQATSILTSNSDEKGSSHRNGSTSEGAGWSNSPSMRSKSIPDVVDLERLGSGQSVGTEASTNKSGEIKTSVFINGNISPSEERERVVNRKSSRFRLKDLWRKKGKVEASP
ncbi:MAG: hypothetical protein Q9195_006531 [Heterodermia aff. obscurata]